jgi:hypothetical protein
LSERERKTGPVRHLDKAGMGALNESGVERKWKEEQNVERREIEKRRYMKWFRK